VCQLVETLLRERRSGDRWSGPRSKF